MKHILLMALIAMMIMNLSCRKQDPDAQPQEPQAEQQTVRLPVGSPAPTFTLKTLAGDAVTFTPGQDKLALIEFWAAWCPPCQAAFPKIDRLYQQLRTQGLAVYSVCQSCEWELAQSFVASHPDHTLPVLFDPAEQGDSIGFKDYRIDGFPSFFLVNSQGVIVEHFKGFWDGRSIETLKQTIAQHGIQ